jgi:hypothetical protein
MTKQELLDLTRRERAALDELVAHLDAGDLTTGGVIDSFSIKDVVAHITAWERRLANGLDAWRRGDPIHWPEPGYTIAQVDELNDRDFADNRERPLDDVLAESAMSYERTFALVESIDESEMFAPLPAFGGHIVALIVRANMDEHYREHLDQIDVWIQGQRS